MGSLIDKVKKGIAIASLGALPFTPGCETASETNAIAGAMRGGSELAVMNGANPAGGLIFDTLGMILQGDAQIQSREQAFQQQAQANAAAFQEQAHNENLARNYKFNVKLQRWVDLNGDGRQDYATEFLSKPDANGVYHFERKLSMFGFRSEDPFFSVRSNCPEDYNILWQYYRNGDELLKEGRVTVPGTNKGNKNWIYNLADVNFENLTAKKFRVRFFVGGGRNAIHLTTLNAVVEDKQKIDAYYSQAENPQTARQSENRLEEKATKKTDDYKVTMGRFFDVNGNGKMDDLSEFTSKPDNGGVYHYPEGENVYFKIDNKSYPEDYKVGIHMVNSNSNRKYDMHVDRGSNFQSQFFYVYAKEGSFERGQYKVNINLERDSETKPIGSFDISVDKK